MAHTSLMHTLGDLSLEPLRARLPSFWWSEVVRIRQLIATDAEAASIEAGFLELAADALAQTEEGAALAHAPALWAASHQLKALALAQLRLQREAATPTRSRRPRQRVVIRTAGVRETRV